ncbi:hypothetical protein Lac1_16900 [Claveliimonas bilis]|uniref:Uncharacterized protein n=1 Tax=Claveliimonas bilis TaxID=3028070 RepID=A0ABM8I8E6_9FIRM|nr:hypothetical protein Lac1_16900 [Claveliimonas bilis]
MDEYINIIDLSEKLCVDIINMFTKHIKEENHEKEIDQCTAYSFYVHGSCSGMWKSEQ